MGSERSREVVIKPAPLASSSIFSEEDKCRYKKRGWKGAGCVSSVQGVKEKKMQRTRLNTGRDSPAHLHTWGGHCETE